MVGGDDSGAGYSPAGVARLTLCLLLLATGCMTVETARLNDQGVPVETSRTTIYGRGCVAVTISADGAVDMVSQQDGTTDWIGVRILSAIADEAVSAALGFLEVPFDILAKLVGIERKLDPPSPIHGCGGVFEEV